MEVEINIIRWPNGANEEAGRAFTRWDQAILVLIASGWAACPLAIPTSRLASPVSRFGLISAWVLPSASLSLLAQLSGMNTAVTLHVRQACDACIVHVPGR